MKHPRLVKFSRSWTKRSTVASVGMSLRFIRIAVSELVGMFDVLSDSEMAHELFRGDEAVRPNLDTTLRYTRDLLSASTEPIRLRAREDNPPSRSPADPKRSPGTHYWMQVLKHAESDGEPKDFLEVSRFLDDLYRDIIFISIMVSPMARGGAKSIAWNELYRRLSRLRDHYEHAQHHIINTIKPATQT
jgi:hypothetical protein